MHVHGPVKGLTDAHRSCCVGTRAWAQALIHGIESDAVTRSEAYPAEDVEMDMSGTAVPDDEFHEEPKLDEPKVLEEFTNAVTLAVMRIHKNLGRPSKELLCRALRIEGANRVALRAASELKSDVCMENIQQAFCLQNWRIRSLSSFKELELISLCWRTQMNKCLRS